MAETSGDSAHCPHCTSTDIEVDYSKGESYCNSCGAVQEQELITNSVQYETGASGLNTLVGRNINLGTDGYIGQTGNPLKGGIAQSSKEATMSRNKDRLQALASQSKCEAVVCSLAFRIYKLAYETGYMAEKRPIDTLLSSCLYIASRLMKRGHMLADFVPYIPGDIFALAKSVRFLVTRLYITVPMQSADDLLERFCYALVEDKVLVQKLITMARRIADRMHKDWIDAGRKPGAVAAAAIIIACRVYNHDIDLEAVASVAQVAGVTVRRRLIEFARTESGKLVPSQLGTENLPRAQFHPAIFQARKGKTSAPRVMNLAERKKCAQCVKSLLDFVSGLEDRQDKLSQDEWNDLKHSVISLNTGLEMVESRWKLSHEKSLFIATSLRPAITDETFKTGNAIVCREYLQSLLCNKAEQEIRYRNLQRKHGELLTKRADRKRDAENEDTTTKPKRNTRRKKGAKTAQGQRPGENEPSEGTSKAIDYDRFGDYMRNFDGSTDDF